MTCNTKANLVIEEEDVFGIENYTFSLDDENGLTISVNSTLGVIEFTLTDKQRSELKVFLNTF